MRQLTCLAILFSLEFQAVLAQDWNLQIEENPNFRTAELSQPDGDIMFLCGTVLEGDPGLAEELIISRTDHINLVISERLMGPFGADVPDPQNASAFALNAELVTPPFYFDVMGGDGWVAEIPYDHPLISAAAGGSEAVIKPDTQEPFSLYGPGLPDGMSKMLEFCATTPAATQPDNINSELLARVEAEFQSVCQGSYEIDPSAIREHDFTGDGVDDLLVNFSSLICTSGIFSGKTRLSCDEDMCRRDIVTHESPTPIILYATQIQAVEDVPGDISIYFDASSCIEMIQKEDCAARMRWTGSTFGTIGFE